MIRYLLAGLSRVRFKIIQNGENNIVNDNYTYPATTTWNKPWKNKGGDYAGTICKTNGTGQGKLRWENFNVTEALNDMLSLNLSNEGFLIKSNVSTTVAYYLSSNSPDIEHRPKFTIKYVQLETTPPVVKVLSPNGGEEFIYGSDINVTWEASDNDGVSSQKIYLTDDDGGSWKFLDSLGKDERSYTFKAPRNITNKYSIKVLAIDNCENSGADICDATFRVNPDTTNPSEDLLVFGGWDQYKDDMGSSFLFNTCNENSRDTIIMSFSQKAYSGKEYPYVDLVSILPNGSTLGGVKWISITYKSNVQTRFELYNEKLSELGENYSTILPLKGINEWQTSFFIVDDTTFKQPDYVKNSKDLDLRTMTGILIKPDFSLAGGNANIVIENIVLYDYNPTGINDNIITSDQISLMSQINYTGNGKISLNLTEAGRYKLSLYKLNGKILNKRVYLFKREQKYTLCT